jgi:non-heme chloroperoxidase
MPYVTVAEENSGPVELYYEDHGSGRPIVLSHGWPLSSAAWEKQLTVLLEAGYRVIMYDRRGFGQSSKPSFGYDYDTFAQDLNALFTKLDLRDAAIVGHSMGSGEAGHYVGTFGTERVSQIVLVASILPFLLKTGDNPTGVDGSVFDGIKAAIEKDRHAYATEFMSNFYDMDVFGGNRVSDEVCRSGWNIADQSSPIAFRVCVDAWLTDFRPDLPRLTLPVLIIHGTGDRILPYESTAQPLEGMLEDVRLVTVDGGPHGLPWSHAEVVNDELVSFLAEHTSVGAGTGAA